MLAGAWLLAGWGGAAWAGPTLPSVEEPVRAVAGDGLHLDWALPGPGAALRVTTAPDLVVVEVDGPVVERRYVAVDHPWVLRVLVHPRRGGGSALRVRLRGPIEAAALAGVRARLDGATVAVDVPLSGVVRERWAAGAWPRPLVPVVVAAQGALDGRGSDAPGLRLRAVPVATPPVVAGSEPGRAPLEATDAARAGLGWVRWLAVGVLAVLAVGLAGWSWRRRRLPAGDDGVLGRLQVGPGEWIVGVRVGARVLVLGVAEGRCTPLATWPAEGAAAGGGAGAVEGPPAGGAEGVVEEAPP